MAETEKDKSPSQGLAEDAAASLLAAQLIREKDLDVLRNALGTGTATAEQWISWMDLTVAEQEGGADE